MTTKRQLIMDAFEEIGIAESFDVSPEEMQSCLRRMDSMAAEWDGVGIRVGYNLGGALDDEAGIPDTANNCFAVNLGTRIARKFGKTVTTEAKVEAAQALNAMMVARRVMPEVPYPPGLPIGTGSRRGVMEQKYFGSNNGEVAGLNDGATEY